MGARVLSGFVCGDRRRSRTERSVRWRIYQSPRQRSRRSFVQYIRRAMAHIVLQRELSALAASQGAVGSAQRVPSHTVDSMISLRSLACVAVLVPESVNPSIRQSVVPTTAIAQSSRTQIVMLGTGTPIPDPDRSGPATAIIVD